MKQARRKFRYIIVSIKGNVSLKGAERERIRRILAVIVEKTQ
jgi:hypothetical protein